MRIARPLYELVGVTRQIGAGRLEARAQLECGGLDELATLARAVNDTADRIGKQLRDQRELLGGVSHELRTPLGHLRVLVEVARDQGAPAGTLAEMEREIVEMDELVGALLASARLEFQAARAVPLDAAAAARRALERAGLPAERLVAPVFAVEVTADPALLARALANLLANAEKHGGGARRLRVEADPQAVAFVVEDDGPGFPAGGAEPLPPRPEGSLGLGLPLVARIAEAHGGSIATSNRPEGGARVTLRLPAAAR